MEVVAITILFVVVNLELPSFIGYGLQQQAIQVSPFFVHGAPDRLAIDRWAHLPNFAAGGTSDAGYLTITDAQGTVITSVGKAPVPTGLQLADRLSSTPASDLRRVLAGGTGDQVMVGHQSDGSLIVIVPIKAADGHIEGALIQMVSDLGASNRFWIGVYGLGVILPTALIVVVFAAIAGTIFGLMTARRLSRRLTRLSTAVDGWSRGDFSKLVEDRSPDEIGQLAAQLDRMAERLRDLLDVRQEMAAVDERNRLARDLHDSVKQEIFAVSMQLSTAKVLLTSDREAAAKHLAEAARLVDEVKGELTMLVRQLRPAVLAGAEKVRSLSDYADDWSRQTGIPVDVRLEMEEPPSPDIEQALFRIVQEGLSNVARHSGASHVRLHLQSGRRLVTLTIADDGSGYDPASGNGPGVGLQSMRERAEAIGGDLVIESVGGKGTTITVRRRR